MPDEDKSIFGRSVNKQIFEGLMAALLQTVATVLGQLQLPKSDGESSRICSPDIKSKTATNENFNTRVHDLIRSVFFSNLSQYINTIYIYYKLIIYIILNNNKLYIFIIFFFK